MVGPSAAPSLSNIELQLMKLDLVSAYFWFAFQGKIDEFYAILEQHR